MPKANAQRCTLWALAGLLAAPTLAGCRTISASPAGRAFEKDLSPIEYIALRDEDRIRYKDVVIRIPDTWGGVLLPADKGPYRDPTEKAVHGGDVVALMGLYNQALFELQHPRVKIEYIGFDMWTENFKSALAVAIAARRAPSYYIARDLPQTIEQGMYADLTDLMKKWDQYEMQPEGSRREGTFNGRIYTLSANEFGAQTIRYRKDWFRDAGIFNEHGEPGPRADWTFEDFRALAKKLTDPKKGRFGYACAMGGYGSIGYLYALTKGCDFYVPDPAGKQTWKFNLEEPGVLEALKQSREMINQDRSVLTSVAMNWQEWHAEFDAGHAAMMSGFSPHVLRDSLDQPYKMGKDKLFTETVGMTTVPVGTGGISAMRPQTNPIGFDPTLSKEQLEAAFEWCKSWFYGDIFANRIRAATQDARAKGKGSTLYVELMTLPYKPAENLLDRPLESVFPRQYIEVYAKIREAHAPPLPREFGLREPPVNEWEKQMNAMFSRAITTKTDLKQILRETADLVNTTVLNYREEGDTERLRRYLAARTEFYRRYHPAFYEREWKAKLEKYYRLPPG